MSLSATLDSWESQTDVAAAAISGAVPSSYVWGIVLFLSLIVGAGLTWLLYINIRRTVQMGTVAKTLPQLRALIQSHSEEIQRLKEGTNARGAMVQPESWPKQDEKLHAFVSDQLAVMREELNAKTECVGAQISTIAEVLHQLQSSSAEFPRIHEMGVRDNCKLAGPALMNDRAERWSAFLHDQLALMRAEMDFDAENGDRRPS